MHPNKFTTLDIDKIRHLQPEGWTDITNAFSLYCNYDFCHPIKITIDNQIVGTGNSILFENTAWLAHIIVGSEFRNRGIGYKIVDCLLNDIKASAIETSLLIATELGQPVYVKAGFRKVSDYRFFKRESQQIGKQLINNILPFKDDFYNDIIELDNYVSGEKRERLLKNYIGNSFVYINKNVIEGFYIPGLGEGPIFALTPDAGRELMNFKYATVDNADMPGENLAGIEFIKQMGFTEINKTATRMILGPDIQWKPEMIYSRIGGNFG